MNYQNDSRDAQNKFPFFILNNMLDRMLGHVYWKDKKGAYLGCNLAQAKSLGLKSPTEIIGKTDYDLSPDAQADNLTREDQNIMKTAQAKTIEEVVTLENGQQAIFLSHKFPIFELDAQVAGIFGISFNITQQKEAEEREKIALAKAKTEEETRRAVMILVGSMAHDMRTSLIMLNLLSNKISEVLPVFTEAYQLTISRNLPLSKTLSSEQFEVFSTMTHVLNKAIIEMNSFVNDSLTTITSVLTNNLTKEELVTCSIDYCVRNVLQRYLFKDNERRLVHWDRDYNFEFKGNPILFFRIIFNLIENALCRIRAKGGEIYLSADSNDKFNFFKVKDTAGGLCSETTKNIFYAFSNNQEGNHIGLAFCKLAMQRFGGDIICYSIDGEHTEFQLQFPKC